MGNSSFLQRPRYRIVPGLFILQDALLDQNFTDKQDLLFYKIRDRGRKIVLNPIY